VIGDVRSGKMVRVLGQDARDVHGDIADADDGGGGL